MSSYSISWLNRNQLTYSEGSRTLKVEVEDAFTRPITEPVGPQHVSLWYLMVYTKSIRQWDDGTPITSDERERIAGNISEALKETGTKHVLK